MATAAVTHAAVSSSNSAKKSLLTRRLYRSLLRAAQPFSTPSPHASVLGCLLHRSGVDDHIRDWDVFVTSPNPHNSGKSGDDDDDHGDDNKENDWRQMLRTEDQARDLSQSYIMPNPLQPQKQQQQLPHRSYQRLFRRLLREVVTGTDGYAKMIFPSQVDTDRLKLVIRREFRAKGRTAEGAVDVGGVAVGNIAASSAFDDATRHQVAFVALRELHKKLRYYDNLVENAPTPIPHQAAYNVSPLPFSPPSSFLRPGCFLVSHPLLNDGFFSKTVICILQHQAPETESLDGTEDGDSSTTGSESIEKPKESGYHPPGQTYGVIVNRVSENHETGRQRTLREAFQEHMLPAKLAEVFGSVVVREGGPVHVALQMIHSLSPSSSTDPIMPSLPLPKETNVDSKKGGGGDDGDDDDDDDDDDDHYGEPASKIGGTLIPAIVDGDQSSALYSDRATYFRGNMFKAMDAVKDGSLDRDDISFFVGASTWAPGQLASEIAQGYWMPMRAPPEIALHGICEHESPMPPPPVSKTDASNDEEGRDRVRAPTENARPLADLWLSMMSAVSPPTADLALLFHHEAWDECGLPCDAFDDDDDDDDIVIF